MARHFVAILCCFASLELIGPALRAETVVIRAGGYLDVERGKIVKPAVIVVEDDKISAINPGLEPAGAETIDLDNRIVLPGLMDMHTHLTYDLEGDWVNRPVKETAPDWALRGARNAKRTLEAGITTVRDIWAAGGMPDVALMHAIEEGMVVGPRMFASGNALSITGGHCEHTGFAPGILEGGPHEGVADGPDEVIKAVRYQIKHGANVIKICATAGVLSFEGPVGAQQYSLEEMEAVVEEAARHGVRVAAHAHGTEGIIAASQAGVASVEHASILTDEAVGVLKENGTWVVFNLYLVEAIDRESLPEQTRAKMDYVGARVYDSFTMAIDGGLKMAFGTDAGVYPHGDNAKELTAQVKHGLQPIEAIRGATIHAAELLGVEDRGVIETGRYADLIAVEGNPIDDISLLEDVAFVMKGGVIYKTPF
jgi:imidazolonepropionase-like amidohydrolase